ncbi:transcriptional regulator of nitric oxide reductase [Duganella sp. SG902]|uniref:4Fe-4S binding protein n=1 Tax=Duganella sp. SG902 TaxID=2587016 RepID=UPI00159E04F0|nr:4Fe-4S binding protein [Duganella sp. SG902]NVM80171.1 transcriptional regulator of nitric oxide reductase [Duganella sp. SG902]
MLCMLAGALALLLGATPAQAGVLTRADVARRFPAPLIVGERDAELPVWPLFKQDATAVALAGYVFESADLAPIPGFAGVPLNLLVAMDAQGIFTGVEVLSHHEPVFLEGLGDGPLKQFVQQYRGLSLKQNISIGGTGRVHIDGVAKATASVRIINQSVLAAALKVARARLGYGAGRDPGQIAQVREDIYQPLDLGQMLRRGLVQYLRVSNREVEQLFKGSDGAGLDAEARTRPDGTFIELYLAMASVPTVGRNLLTETGWRKLQSRLEPGEHALMVMTAGRHSLTGEGFVRGSVPDRILLRQDQLPIEMRDVDLDLKLAVPLETPNVTLFRVTSQAGLDPAAPLDIALPITRSKGIIYPERIVRELGLRYQLPAELLIAPEADAKSWSAVWEQRRWELLVLAMGLLVLSVALLMQKWLVAGNARLAWFRWTYLAYTVGFVGYYAQGQLSIVNITGALQALLAGRGLTFMLFDPMTVALWGFVLFSLLLWGRGTFCGWLCPFGALQEFVGKAARWLRGPQLRMRHASHMWLGRAKYVSLVAIAVSVFLPGQMTDRLVELEPFKTTITLGFVRAWPYAAYAAALLLAGGVVYKFFCRYLCPFGAALALLGKVRLLNWIPRYAQCGTPCQTCRHRCDYQAIAPDGKVAYDECFQCLDCVAIYESDQRCALRIGERKQSVIPIREITRSRA